MLHALRGATQLTVHALDGPIGQIDDVWLDDRHWVVRYLRVDARVWLGRAVLVSPISIRTVDRTGRRIALRLIREQLRSSPDVPSVEVFTPDRERSYLEHYRYSPYWVGERLWGLADVPRSLAAPPRPPHRPDPPPAPKSGSLRSLRDLMQLSAYADNGEIGRLDDLLVADDSWRVRYLAIDAHTAPGHTALLVPLELVSRWDVANRILRIAASAQHVRLGPSVPAGQPLNDSLERLVQRHYAALTRGETARRGSGLAT